LVRQIETNPEPESSRLSPPPRVTGSSLEFVTGALPSMSRYIFEDPKWAGNSAGETAAEALKREQANEALLKAVRILEPVHEWNDAMSWLKAYRALPATAGAREVRGADLGLSVYRDPEIGIERLSPGILARIRSLNRPLVTLISDESLQEHLRSSWSNEDLETLLAFQRMRERALKVCTDLLRDWSLKNGNGVYAEYLKSDRIMVIMGWANLLGLLEDPASLQPEGSRFTAAGRLLAWILGKLGLEGDARFDDLRSAETASYIRALSLLMFPPVNSVDLLPRWNLPMQSGSGLLARLESEGLGKSQLYLRDWQDTYRSYRDKDQPELPVHPAPHPEAPHVVFVDTGIDWETYPDLGLFMGLGREGELSQQDLADGDDNPWVPAVGDLAHGSGVVATLLTVLAQQSPRLLEERKLDIAMWKTASLRSLLSNGSNPDLRRFDLRHELSFGMAFWNLQSQSRGSIRSGAPQPDIISISASYPIWSRLGGPSEPLDLGKGPWIWVMAAGNSASDLDRGGDQACMGDVPEEKRPGSKLICVGALKKGILRDSIARYSNYGERVDVYAHESASGLCPSGTSCSTPAVTAGLTMIKAKYPGLGPELLKRVLIEAASERQVEQELRGKKTLVRVRVFDPSTMMNKAYSIAARAARGQWP